MDFWLSLLIAATLFCSGLWLASFYSGTEFGFYRVSFLRLSIDSHAGDRKARLMLWFVQHPEWFVATSLVGNNVAHYLTTLAIVRMGHAATGLTSPLVEVGVTLLFVPVLFVFGELMPKNLYLRAPTLLLRRWLWLFRFSYQCFLPLTWPLVQITRLLEKLSGARPHQLELVLGRHRLLQVLNKGHEHGLLTAGQGQLLHGLLHDATRPATEVMTPVSRLAGLDETATRETVLRFARTSGQAVVPLRTPRTEAAWVSCVRVADLEFSSQPVSAVARPLPRLNRDVNRLSALLLMRNSGHSLAAICDRDTVLGLVSERVLIEHFMNPTRAGHSERLARGPEGEAPSGAMA